MIFLSGLLSRFERMSKKNSWSNLSEAERENIRRIRLNLLVEWLSEDNVLLNIVSFYTRRGVPPKADDLLEVNK